MSDQWQELKETIVELRDSNGTGTQQEVCKFLVNYMGILEKQMQEPCKNTIDRQAVLDIVDSYSESQSNVEDVTQDIISDIVALLPVNSQPCEDAISRQAVLDMMQMRVSGKELYKAVYDLPPVTPQAKTSHWIDDKCSVCGKGIEDLIDSREWYRNEEPNFCPFCGTKMVEPQESEDLGDYPDTIHNQFDNMTGSINL